MTEFITVNGQSIDIEDALAWQGIAGNTELRDNIVAMAAVIQHCSNNGITANAAEIQSFLDEFRYADEMENAEEFSAWLKENGFTNEALQAFCEVGVLRNKMRSSITDDQVSEHFSQNKSSYDMAELYRIDVENEDLANEIHTQLEDEEAGFMELALTHSVDETGRKGGYLGDLRRNDIDGEIEASVFSSSEGDILGPFKDEDEGVFSIFRVGRLILAEHEMLLEAIRDELFENLLKDLSSKAEVKETLRLSNSVPG